MPRSDDQIFAMLEKELRKDPNAATAFLKEKVAEIKKSVGKMSLRSFHGTYVGSVKRKISGRKGGRKKGAKVKKAAGRWRRRLLELRGQVAPFRISYLAISNPSVTPWSRPWMPLKAVP